MKKFNLSLVTVLAMSTFAIAGGDVAPVEPVVEMIEEPVVIEDRGFYLGVGYGFLSADRTVSWYDFANGVNVSADYGTEDYDQIMLQAGYKFNSYVAVEGRYWLGLSDNAWATISNNPIQSVGEIDAWGIYVKPMYPVTGALDIYALLGYAKTEYDITNALVDSGNLDGFSWGLGASYEFSNNFSVFIDYTELYSDNTTVANTALGSLDVDESIDVTTIGVSYRF
jgi:opacity protein-like surface antigen